MKHSCTACQMCSPVSIGEMSVSLPPFEIFSPKKEMETLFACKGEGGRGRSDCWWKWERERGERGRSHLDLLYGHFHWRKSGEETRLDLLAAGGGQGGDSKQKGSKRRR